VLTDKLEVNANRKARSPAVAQMADRVDRRSARVLGKDLRNDLQSIIKRLLQAQFKYFYVGW
jgi:membrane protein required for beta-lactamase induction